jgi:hypothetical protein
MHKLRLRPGRSVSILNGVGSKEHAIHRRGTMSWFAPSPLAAALIVAVVVGLAALIETTLIAAPEVLPPQRAAPRASPPVTIKPSRSGVIDLRAHTARFPSAG